MKIPDSRTTPDLTGARFLLKPGRKYEDAVKQFSPYGETKEKNHDARAAGARLIKESLGTQPRRGTYIFVNNRLEGNAPMTIFSRMERAGACEPPDRTRFTVKTTFGTLAQNRRFIFRGREYLKTAQIRA